MRNSSSAIALDISPRAAAPSAARLAALRAALEPRATPALLAYAQLVMARSPAVGALLLLATLASPRLFVSGLLAVLLALALARALRFSPELVASGAYGYNALLVGLGAAASLAPTPGAALLGALAVAATVLLFAALHAALGAGYGLPVLTLPFLVAHYALLCAAAPLGLLHPAHATDFWAARLALPGAARGFLSALGSLLFLPRVDVGAIVLIALVWHSRIAALLAALAFALVSALALAWPPLHQPATAMLLALNAMLVAMALGGAWFVPDRSAFALGLAGALLATALGLGMLPRMRAAGLPVLIVPFNAVVLLAVYALRQRAAEGGARAVDFVPGTPEQNLAYFRSRTERFGAVQGLRFFAPFRGAWTCSQGVNGTLTHQGAWRDALDFEVRDADGRAHRDAGTELSEYYCYRLPVVATAAGVVARIVEGVRDNAVGEVNLEDNWGNAVVLAHGPGLYSCVAHLAPGTVAVREGQHVAAGEVLGACGNSGRSATPHIHMQLQASAELGAPTLPIRLHDLVREGLEGARELLAAHAPAEGERVRRLEADAERARLLRWEFRRPVRVRVEGGGGPARAEVLVPDIDLAGRCLLRSETTGAVLYYEHGAAGLAIHDVQGDPESALHLLRIALSRVPCDADEALRWTDLLPLRRFLPAWARPVFDAISPLGVNASLAVSYTTERRGRALVVRGESARRERGGAPWVASCALLSPAGGVSRIEVSIRGETFTVEFDATPRGSAAEAAETRGGGTAGRVIEGGTVHVQS